MKFFKPIVQLARQANFDQPDTFFLHIITFCPRSNFRADGHSVSADRLTSQGIYDVTIRLQQEAGLLDMDYLTPVVHTLDLGVIDFPGGEGLIEVQVVDAVQAENGAQARGDNTPTTTTRTGGTGTVSTTDSDNKVRPFDPESLYAHF